MSSKVDILDPIMDSLLGDISKHTLRIPLVPSQWKQYAGKSYKWQTVPYSRSGIAQVPDDKMGVYCFVVNPGLAGHELGYLLYVGKAQRQSLRKRFQQYFLEHRNPKGRVLVRQMLEYWSGHLEFRYTTLPSARVSQVEAELLKAFIPHANGHFDAMIRPAVKAFRNQ